MSNLEKKALDYFHETVVPAKVVDVYKTKDALARNLSGERATEVRTMVEAHRVLEGRKPNPNRLFSGTQIATSGFVPDNKSTNKPK